MAGVLQLLGKLPGRKPIGTSPDQVTNRGGQAAVFRKADVLVVPDALAVKLGRVLQGVPLAVIGVTSEIAHLIEEPTHGDEGVIQSLGQLGQHPAFAAMEEFFQTFGGEQLMRPEVLANDHAEIGAFATGVTSMECEGAVLEKSRVGFSSGHRFPLKAGS